MQRLSKLSDHQAYIELVSGRLCVRAHRRGLPPDTHDIGYSTKLAYSVPCMSRQRQGRRYIGRLLRHIVRTFTQLCASERSGCPDRRRGCSKSRTYHIQMGQTKTRASVWVNRTDVSFQPCTFGDSFSNRVQPVHGSILGKARRKFARLSL